jgi:hypothetical protein
LIFLSLGVLGFSSLNCSGPQKQNSSSENNLSSPKTTSLGERLTTQGNNSQVFYHSSGTRFLFVSSNRNNHTEKQVYEYDFKSQKERRVTFNDGIAQWPAYLQDSQVVYSSNTDALKEYPPRLYKELHEKNWAPFDIYSSDLFGNGIKRWTEALEADTHPTPWKDSFVFLKQRPSAPDLQTANGKVLYRSTGSLLKLEAHPKSNQIYALEQPISSEKRRLIVVTEGQKEPKVLLESPDLVDFSLGKSSGGVLVLMQNKLVNMDPAKMCFVNLKVFKKDEVQSATWSPDEKTVILESKSEGSSHLYLWNFPTQRGECESLI